MINHVMTQLVHELLAADVPDPLTREFTLAAIWDDLARLGGELAPDHIRVALGEEVANPRPLRYTADRLTATGGDRSINGILGEHLVKLEWWGIPTPLTQPFVLGPLWADLSRLAGEDEVPAVRDLLDWRVYQTLVFGPRGVLGKRRAGGEGR